MKRLKVLKGFTLMEIITAVVLVVILSVISTPIYKNYVRNAVMAEGYALLAIIRSAQEAYFNEYAIHYYHNGMITNYDPVLGIDARLNKYYKTFTSANNLGIPADAAGNARIGFQATAICVDGRAPNIKIIYNRTEGMTIS